MLPLLLSDKPAFFGSLGAALLSLIAAILIPRVTMNAIDDALIARTSSLAPVRLDPARARRVPRDPHLRLPHVALRHRVPARVRPAGHRVRAPHADVVLVLRPCAVGSADLAGELRHPIGADVPDLRAARRAQPRELRRRTGLHVHDPRRPDARRARHDPVRVHRRRQDAEPDVPTLVDRAIADGRRRDDRRRERERRARREILRSRASPGRRAGQRCTAGAMGLGEDLDDPGSLRAPHGEPPSPRPRCGAAVRRVARHRRRDHRRRDRRVQQLRRDAPGALPHPRDDHDARPAGGGLGRADLRDPRRARRHRRPAGGHRPRRTQAATSSSATSRSPTTDRARRPTSPSSRTSTCTCGRARPLRSSGARAAGSRRSPDSSPASTTSTAARCSSTGTTSATSRCTAFERTSQSCSTSPSSSRSRSATTSPTPVPTRHSTT